MNVQLTPAVVVAAKCQQNSRFITYKSAFSPKDYRCNLINPRIIVADAQPTAYSEHDYAIARMVNVETRRRKNHPRIQGRERSRHSKRESKGYQSHDGQGRPSFYLLNFFPYFLYALTSFMRARFTLIEI
jgi:hypothetical protein